MKNKVDLNNCFQPYPIAPPVTFDSSVEEINRTCDKLITELCGIKKRIQAIQKMTSRHGPAIDAEMYVNKTIKYLEHQKR